MLNVIVTQLIWLILATAAGHALAAAPTSEFTLKNGLKLIVHEDHRAPVVVSQIWYRVGSSYEPEGLTGVSHALEHMLFKGTKKFGPGEFSKIIANQGGRENAFTGYDYTAYFQQLAKDRLPYSFRLEADRMQNALIDAAEFAKEIKVVIEERRLRTEDNPRALTNEAATALAFQTSPYRQPIIGWMHDLESMQATDLALWYKRWYTPNNAIVVVAGDVEPQAVLALAKKYYGRLRRRSTDAPRAAFEAPQLGPKRGVVEVPARVPYLVISFKAPAMGPAVANNDLLLVADCYALEVLNTYLAGNDTSRLVQNLIRERKLATAVNSSYELYARLNTLLEITATPSANSEVATLETAILTALRGVKEELVSGPELERLKTSLLTERIYRTDSLFYQAMQIGALEAVGLSWRLRDDYANAINAVTAADLKRVANQYLITAQMTITRLDPQPDPVSAESPVE